VVKRIFAAFALVIFFCVAVITPALALDFMTPAVVSLSVFAILATGGMAATPIGIAMSGSIALHAGIIAFAFDNVAPTSGNDAPLVVMLATKTPLPNIPGTWGNPVFPAFQAVPPSTDAGFVALCYQFSGSFGTSCSADAATTFMAVTHTTGYHSSTSATGTPVVSPGGPYACDASNSCAQAVTNSAHCTTAGYSVSGTTCILSNASLVIKPTDGKRSISRTGNILTADTQDTTDIMPTAITGSGTGTITMVSSNGASQVITIAGDGTATIVDTQPNSDGLTSTKRSITLGAPDATSGVPVVTGISTQQVNGVGAPAAASGAVAPAAAGVVFPTDYSRAGEAATAAGTINAKLDVLHDDLTNSTHTATTDPVVPPDTDFTNNFFLHTFDNILAWRLPSHTSTCPTLSLDLSGFFGVGHTFTVDEQCTLAESQRTTLSSVMVVVFLIGAFFIVLGA